ncbi:MAG TPA: outer membrane protein assembly factor BamA, partial [Aquifex aeolicus]|nr:outer membrane protein assembly factor BamA [Aquifex aeolicus]
MKRLLYLLPVLLFFTNVSFSQRVGKIEVKGNRYVTQELVKEILLTKEGSEFSLDKVRRDIKRLFRTGFFKRIEVHKFEEDGSIRLVYVVEDLPVIYRIEFEGNKELDDEDLADKLGVETEVGKVDVDELITGYTSSPALEERIELQRSVKLGRVLSPREINFLIQRLRDIYLEEGYPDVEITYEIVPKKGASKLVFHIREGEEKYVRHIIFKGNESFSAGKLKDLMRHQDRNILIFRLKPPFSEEVLEDDIKSIREFYRREGFLEVEVSYRVDRKGGRHDIFIFIKEGPRYKLKELTIEGNELYAYSELVGDILKKNERKGGFYRAQVIERIKENIRSLYAEIGFANVLVEEDRRVDLRKKEVSVKLRIDEGEPVY